MNLKTTRLILALILSIFLAAVVRADLKWEQTTLDLHPAISDKQAIGHFKYENVGKTPVRFKSVHTSCGCTVAQTQKDQVGPGEKGEITATFNIGGRTGVQVKNVTVETDDPAHAVTVLTLKATIGQVLEIQPTFVYWQGGEEPKAKTIIVRSGKDVPIKKLDVTSSSPDFAAKVEPGSAPGEFNIKVQPHETNRAIVATLTIKPDYPANPPQLFYANARVMPAPATQ